MLIGSVVLYLALPVVIGPPWAVQRAHISRDFVLAGRSLPLYLSAASPAPHALHDRAPHRPHA
jgi:solute:Na+ symporter, SSS family